MVVLNLLPYGSSWQEFCAHVPEFAERVQNRFNAFAQHILATVSPDGSPRVSGTELFWVRGNLIFGVPQRSRKASDLARDLRVAIHSNPGDGSMSEGDFKLNGRAVKLTEPDLGEFSQALHISADTVLYQVRISRVVSTALDGENTKVQLWTPSKGLITTG